MVLLGRLCGVPQHEHLLGRLGDLAGEDVRMPPHHLVGEPARDVVDVERLLGVARGDLGMEQHLPEQIAEFLAQLVARSGLDGVDQLGALLDEVGHQRAVVDLLRPDAAVANRAHRVGGRAQRVALPSRGSRARSASSGSFTRHLRCRGGGEPPMMARTPGDERSGEHESDERSREHTEDGLVAHERVAVEGEVGQQQRDREPDAAQRPRREEVAEGQLRRGPPSPNRCAAQPTPAMPTILPTGRRDQDAPERR